MQVVIPIYDSFTALDAIGPYEVLSRLPGATVTFAAAEARVHRTDTDFLGVTADVAVDDVDACDVLVVPGGPRRKDIMNDETLISFVQRVHPGTTWTTSVCTGALLLGAAGILDGLTATTHWAAKGELESTGATYTAQRVVQQGKVVTAAGVSSGIDMALTLVDLIAGDEVAKAIQLGIEYDPQPPHDSGSEAKASDDTVALLIEVMAGDDR